MIERAVSARVPFAWVAADEAYGDNGPLRTWLEQQHTAYVLAVARDHRVPAGVGRTVRADELAARLPRRAWQRLSAGDGAKGHRWYDWAWVTISNPGPGHRLLLAARTRMQHRYQPRRRAQPLVVAGLRCGWYGNRCRTVSPGMPAPAGLAGRTPAALPSAGQIPLSVAHLRRSTARTGPRRAPAAATPPPVTGSTWSTVSVSTGHLGRFTARGGAEQPRTRPYECAIGVALATVMAHSYLAASSRNPSLVGRIPWLTPAARGDGSRPRSRLRPCCSTAISLWWLAGQWDAGAWSWRGVGDG